MSSSAPLTDDVVSAIAAFFLGGAGPRHKLISDVLTRTGYGDDWVYGAPDAANKETRVRAALHAARRQPVRSRELLEGLLSLLRTEGLIGAPEAERTEDELRLRQALGRASWYLDDDGMLRPFGGIDLETGGRAALDEQVHRLRASAEDPALLIGTAKDMLEAVAKFVLEELGMTVPRSINFDGLWHIARERLGLLPERVDLSQPGGEAIRAIHQSSWTIAQNVNALRNLQGTGHGRTLPTGVSEDLAMLVVREACSVAEFMLRQLDRQIGRG